MFSSWIDVNSKKIHQAIHANILSSLHACGMHYTTNHKIIYYTGVYFYNVLFTGIILLCAWDMYQNMPLGKYISENMLSLSR